MGPISWCHTFLSLFSIIYECHAAILESVYWNSSNTKFTPRQGVVLFPQIGDKLDIICPRVRERGDREEFYRVFLVTRSQMQRCTVDQSETPLLNCDKPQQDVKFTVKFQEVSPNLWGLEFLKGRDYYITSTSSGSLRGLDDTVGGVCQTKSMKLVLRVGQRPSDPPSPPQESPTRFPPRLKNKNKNEGGVATGSGENGKGSDMWLVIGVVSGCLVLVLSTLVLLAMLWRRWHPQAMDEAQLSASLPLNTLAMAKRESIGSDNDGSDRSEIVFPLRPSESMLCRHYDRRSTDYASPVYLLQDAPPQSPTHVYYKV